MKYKNLLILISLVAIGNLYSKEFRIMPITNLNQIKSLEFFNEDSVEELSLSKDYVTTKYKVPPENRVLFYEKFPDIYQRVKPKPRLIIEFPKNNKDCLVVLKSSNDPEKPIDYFVIEDDDKNFPESSVMIYNLMDKTVKAKLGDEKIKIDPNQTKIVTLKNKMDENAPFNAKVVFAAPKDGEINFFYSTHWYVPKAQKLFCVITEDPVQETYELSKISIN